MARAATLGGRFDMVVFGACILIALVMSALPDQMREPVAAALRRTIVAPLVGLQTGAERWRAAWLESERKTLQRDSVGMQLTRVQGLEVENDRLRKLLGLGRALGWGFVPAEALHTEGRTESVVTTLTLTAGRAAGVAQYSPVVAPEGIVGIVQTVDPRMSIAILYSHPDFRVSAMSADGSAFGIVYPHMDVAPTRMSERYLLELRNVPFRSALEIGTEIFSSGIGGAWPRGVLIGTVVSEISETETWSRTYLVRPAVNPAHVTAVMILTPQRARQGVGTVWTTPPEAPAAKAAAAPRRDSVRADSASDSIRVDSARQDSVRRALRLRDSLRRDSVRRDSIRKDSIRKDSIRKDTIKPDTGWVLP
jgi:rod shape-determining protein MreC